MARCRRCLWPLSDRYARRMRPNRSYPHLPRALPRHMHCVRTRCSTLHTAFQRLESHAPAFHALTSALPTPPRAAVFDGQPEAFEEGLRLWMRRWNGAPTACHPCARVVLMRQQAIPAHLAFLRRFLCGAWRGTPSRLASEAIYHFKSCATTDRCASGPLPPLPLGPISFAGVLKSSNARPLALDKAYSLILT